MSLGVEGSIAAFDGRADTDRTWNLLTNYRICAAGLVRQKAGSALIHASSGKLHWGCIARITFRLWTSKTRSSLGCAGRPSWPTLCRYDRASGGNDRGGSMRREASKPSRAAMGGAVVLLTAGTVAR
jgi:hypothetical protein